MGRKRGKLGKHQRAGKTTPDRSDLTKQSDQVHVTGMFEQPSNSNTTQQFDHMDGLDDWFDQPLDNLTQPSNVVGAPVTFQQPLNHNATLPPNHMTGMPYHFMQPFTAPVAQPGYAYPQHGQNQQQGYDRNCQQYSEQEQSLALVDADHKHGKPAFHSDYNYNHNTAAFNQLGNATQSANAFGQPDLVDPHDMFDVSSEFPVTNTGYAYPQYGLSGQLPEQLDLPRTFKQFSGNQPGYAYPGPQYTQNHYQQYSTQYSTQYYNQAPPLAARTNSFATYGQPFAFPVTQQQQPQQQPSLAAETNPFATYGQPFASPVTQQQQQGYPLGNNGQSNNVKFVNHLTAPRKPARRRKFNLVPDKPTPINFSKISYMRTKAQRSDEADQAGQANFTRSGAFKFLDLPPELQLEIIKYASFRSIGARVSNKSSNLDKENSRKSGIAAFGYIFKTEPSPDAYPPALARVNQSIRADVLREFYDLNKFIVALVPENPQSYDLLDTWLQRIGPEQRVRIRLQAFNVGNKDTPYDTGPRNNRTPDPAAFHRNAMRRLLAYSPTLGAHRDGIYFYLIFGR